MKIKRTMFVKFFTDDCTCDICNTIKKGMVNVTEVYINEEIKSRRYVCVECFKFICNAGKEKE